MIRLAFIRPRSLKTKLAVYGTATILAAVIVLTALAVWVVRRDIQQGVADTQTALAEAVQKTLDEKITDRKRIIALAAGTLTSDAELTPERIHEYVRARPVLQYHFDALFVADKTGRILYDVPELPGRRGNTVANRDYFRIAVGRGDTVVSEPVVGKTTREPNIVFASPIRSENGQIIGMLGGIMFLSRANFLGELGDARIGKQGYFALVTKGDKPTILMHGHRDRVMTPAPDEKTSPHLWKALRGYEGTVEFSNSRGVEGIYTFKSLDAVPWLLLASYPTSEAYAALYERERQIVALAIVFALLSGASLWWFSRTLLSPVDKLADAMHLQLRYPGAATQAIRTESEELSRLVSVYDELMEHKRLFEESLQRSERKFRRIIDRAGDAFISVDSAGRVTEWNRQSELSFGWTRDEALGQPLTGLVMPADSAGKFSAAFSRHTGARATMKYQTEVVAVDKSGKRIPVEISVTGDEEGGAFVANAFIRDISERRAAEERLESSERRLRTVTDNLPMLIGYVDKEQMVRFVNGAADKWLGAKAGTIINRHLSEAVGGEVYAAIQPHVERALGGEQVKFELEATVRGVTGFSQSVYVPDRAPDGAIDGIYVLSTDITSLKTIEKQLVHLARFDLLTGLANRGQLQEKLIEAIARSRRTGTALAVMFLDIDHFKSINDTLGHAAGDEVLQQFASRLKSSVRETDTVARQGGDEFIILLEGLNFAEEANLVARKILRATAEAMSIAGKSLVVTTSIGIVYREDGQLDAAKLLAQADNALYAAKRSGRNTFHLEQGARAPEQSQA